MCARKHLRNTKDWRGIPVFQLRPHSHSNTDNSKQWVWNIWKMQFWDCSPKSCITARCFGGSSAWMELWVTMWQIHKVQELHRMEACGYSNLRWHLDAFAAFPWFGNRLKQIQMHTSTSSAFPSSGRSFKDFLEGLGRDTSPVVTDMKYSLGSTRLMLKENSRKLNPWITENTETVEGSLPEEANEV